MLLLMTRTFSLPTMAPGLNVPPPALLDLYSSALQAHPLPTKIATAAVLAVVGDGLAQRREGKQYDIARAISFVMFDAAYRGGFQHAAFPFIIEQCKGDFVYATAAKLGFGGPFLDQTICAAIECTAFNQLIVVPIIYYPLFFSITGAVQGLTLTQSIQRARANFVDLTLRNWKFWIPAQYIQFAYLGIEWQVPYTCAMGLVWNVILSTLAGAARPSARTSARPSARTSSRTAVAASKTGID